MAEVFKNASVANVGTSSANTIYTAPGNTTSIILGAAIANKSESTAVGVTVFFYDSSANTTTRLLSDVEIPVKTTLEVFSGQKYILEDSDTISIQSDTGSAVDITVGLLEVS